MSECCGFKNHCINYVAERGQLCEECSRRKVESSAAWAQLVHARVPARVLHSHEKVEALQSRISTLETQLAEARTAKDAMQTLLNEWDEDCGKAQAEARRYREALERISANTYGTELCNTEEENNAILASHFFRHQNIAREALKPQELEQT